MRGHINDVRPAQQNDNDNNGGARHAACRAPGIFLFMGGETARDTIRLEPQVVFFEGTTGRGARDADVSSKPSVCLYAHTQLITVELLVYG